MGGVWIFSGPMHCALCIYHRLPPGINLGGDHVDLPGSIGGFQASLGRGIIQDLFRGLKKKGREIWCVHLVATFLTWIFNEDSQ